MKTLIPIRTLKEERGNFEILTFQVMQQRFKSDFMGTLETIGLITFQRTIGENNYYAMTYKVDTSEFRIFNTFHNLVRKIGKNSNWDAQPNVIFEELNGIDCFLYRNEFFTTNEIGLYCFDVMQNNELYARLVAYNLDDALIKLKKIDKKTATKYSKPFTIGDSFRIEKPI